MPTWARGFPQTQPVWIVSARSSPQSLSGELQTLPYVVLLALELLELRKRASAAERALGRLGPHQPEHLSHPRCANAVEGRAVFRREARDFQRVARDHFQVQANLRLEAAENGDQCRQIEKSCAERDLCQQEAIRVLFDAHVLDMRRE